MITDQVFLFIAQKDIVLDKPLLHVFLAVVQANDGERLPVMIYIKVQLHVLQRLTGRGLEGIVLEEEIVKIKQEFPNIILIVSGGINTSADIKRMISLGADWVSIGTMFCTSVESSMSVEAKNKIINATYSDTQKLSTGARQSSLVFSSIEEKDMNNTLGLYHGVRTGTSGHVYVGTGIDMISKIEPVQDIVNRLVQDL